MADIFISYAHEDRGRVGKLADALTDAGFSVWWDRQVSAGSEFSKETAAELAAARLVLVAWSKASVASYWVADEAAEGRDSGRLVPISLDGSAPPLGFRQFQTIDFAVKGRKASAPLEELASTLADRLQAPHRPIASAAHAGRFAVSRRQLAVGAGVLVAGGLGAASLLAGDGGALAALMPKRTGRKARYESIAVLPFTDLSPGKDKDWFAKGIAEEILNILARHDILKVAARSSSFLFADSRVKAGVIAEALGVETLLEGSVRFGSDQLRIAARLIDAETGFQLWSSSYDRKASDLFAVQDEISGAIVRELNQSLRSEVSTSRPRSLEAYEYFLSAKYNAEQRSPASLRRAREEFGKVIALEPKFAPAYALLADAAWRSSVYDHGDMPHDQAMALAQSNLTKAYALDPKSIEARVVDVSLKTLGALDGTGSRDDLPKAERIARSVIAEVPNYLPGYYEIVFNLQVQGRPREALKFARKAIEFDPLGAMSARKLSTTLRFLGRPQEAFDVAARAMAFNSQSNLLAIASYSALADLGQAAKATALLFPLLKAAPDDLTLRDSVAQLLAFLGFEAEALALAPNEVVRDMALLRLGKFGIPGSGAVRADLGGDFIDGVMLFAGRRFEQAIAPLARAAAPRSTAEGGVIARLAACYRAVGAGPAAAAQQGELDRLISEMENNGQADAFYFEAKTLWWALRGDAGDFFASPELSRYLLSPSPLRPPFELDPMFAPFAKDRRHAEAAIKETAHKRQERRALLAEGGQDKVAAIITGLKT